MSLNFDNILSDQTLPNIDTNNAQYETPNNIHYEVPNNIYYAIPTYNDNINKIIININLLNIKKINNYPINIIINI